MIVDRFESGLGERATAPKNSGPSAITGFKRLLTVTVATAAGVSAAAARRCCASCPSARCAARAARRTLAARCALSREAA